MSLVFVIRDGLLTESDTAPVTVFASYPNAMAAPIDFHGPDCTLLALADSLVAPGIPMTLKKEWRDDYTPVLQYEAARRINLVFPEYKQRNYTAHYQSNITSYGSDATAWPQPEQDFTAEYDRGWKYVSDVRAASNSWSAMPTDPTADAIWPPTITPIQ